MKFLLDLVFFPPFYTVMGLFAIGLAIMLVPYFYSEYSRGKKNLERMPKIGGSRMDCECMKAIDGRIYEARREYNEIKTRRGYVNMLGKLVKPTPSYRIIELGFLIRELESIKTRL